MNTFEKHGKGYKGKGGGYYPAQLCQVIDIYTREPLRITTGDQSQYFGTEEEAIKTLSSRPIVPENRYVIVRVDALVWMPE